MTEYTVHFQRGSRVGARSLRMVQVEADTAAQAEKKARADNASLLQQRYRVTRVDHFDGNRVVIDSDA